MADEQQAQSAPISTQSVIDPGAKVLAMTVTFSWLGTVKGLQGTPGGFAAMLYLEPAYWIGDTGRFAEMLDNSDAISEWEKTPHGVWVNVGACTSVVPLKDDYRYPAGTRSE